MSRDVGIPVSITMYEIDFQNTFEAAGKPPEKSQTVHTSVSSDRIRNCEKKETGCEIKSETYHKKRKTIGGKSAQQNGDQTVKAEVSYDREERETYPGKSQQERDCERPREGQRSITWAYKPGEGNGREKESVSNHEKGLIWGNGDTRKLIVEGFPKAKIPSETRIPPEYVNLNRLIGPQSTKGTTRTKRLHLQGATKIKL